MVSLSPDSAAQGALLERDGYVILRKVLDSTLADALHADVNVHLDETLSKFKNGTIAQEEAFGAIAPPMQLVQNRWNLLLNMTPSTLSVIESVMVHAHQIFEDACGFDAEMCDLSALIVDPGSLAQQVHFDTEFSDEDDDNDTQEDEGVDEDHVIRALADCEILAPLKVELDHDKLKQKESIAIRKRSQQSKQKRLITAFIALQDVPLEMGPTYVTPRTANKNSHIELTSAPTVEDTKAVIDRFRDQGIACILEKGDMVLMDSRTIHRGSANTSSTRRILLDFAIVGKGSKPSTYCECIKMQLMGKYMLGSFQQRVQ